MGQGGDRSPLFRRAVTPLLTPKSHPTVSPRCPQPVPDPPPDPGATSCRCPRVTPTPGLSESLTPPRTGVLGGRATPGGAVALSPVPPPVSHANLGFLPATHPAPTARGQEGLEPQKRPKTTPKPPRNHCKTSQNTPKHSKQAPKTPQKRHKTILNTSQNHPKNTPKHPKSAPKPSQNHAENAPKSPKTRPKNAPKST